MKNKIAYLLVFILFLSTLQGLITNAENIKEDVSNRDFTHTVFVEVATSQNCKPCHYWSQSIHDIYDSGEYDFHYVEMVVFDYDGELLNDEATDWYSYYDVGSVPKNIMDGDFRRISNNSETFVEYLNDCGNRAVTDITASMTVIWLGDATIQVNIYIKNNEATQYNGHIRASITEIVSRYNTYYDEPYHFGFLDYAFDMDVAITAGGTYTNSMTWNGNDHQDNHGDDFGDIDPEDIQVIMGVLNNDDGYVDETVKAYVGDNNPPNEPSNPNPADGEGEVKIDTDLSWNCSDPEGDDVTYDVYFGSTSPPPLVKSDHNSNSYDPGTLDQNTTYYWRIIAWDLPGDFTTGPIWHFTTKENTAPGTPTITGSNSGNPNIEYDFTFVSTDPEGDAVMYNVDWGDGDTEWTEYGDSGAEVTLKHTWTSQDTFTIKAHAVDFYGAESDWTEFPITIPRNKAINRPILNFLQNHPYLFPILQLLLQRLGL